MVERRSATVKVGGAKVSVQTPEGIVVKVEAIPVPKKPVGKERCIPEGTIESLVLLLGEAFKKTGDTDDASWFLDFHQKVKEKYLGEDLKDIQTRSCAIMMGLGYTRDETAEAILSVIQKVREEEGFGRFDKKSLRAHKSILAGTLAEYWPKKK